MQHSTDIDQVSGRFISLDIDMACCKTAASLQPEGSIVPDNTLKYRLCSSRLPVGSWVQYSGNVCLAQCMLFLNLILCCTSLQQNHLQQLSCLNVRKCQTNLCRVADTLLESHNSSALCFLSFQPWCNGSCSRLLSRTSAEIHSIRIQQSVDCD